MLLKIFWYLWKIYGLSSKFKCKICLSDFLGCWLTNQSNSAGLCNSSIGSVYYWWWWAKKSGCRRNAREISTFWSSYFTWHFASRSSTVFSNIVWFELVFTFFLYICSYIIRNLFRSEMCWFKVRYSWIRH